MFIIRKRKGKSSVASVNETWNNRSRKIQGWNLVFGENKRDKNGDWWRIKRERDI